MNANKEFLQNLYDAFNRRDIETAVAKMHPNVKWANGQAGGFVHGRDGVRDYWTKQFQEIQPEIEILKFELDEQNRDVVTVHLMVKDFDGNTLADMQVHQIFTIEDGLISLYEIGETETINETIQKNKAANEQ